MKIVWTRDSVQGLAHHVTRESGRIPAFKLHCAKRKQNKIVSNCYETFRKEYNGGLDGVPVMRLSNKNFPKLPTAH